MYAHGTFHAKGPIEHGRRTLETLNELRIVDGEDVGLSETHYLIEESRTPSTEGLSKQEIRDLKKLYDLDKHKTVWRLTTVDKAGNRVTFIAAVRGVDKAGNRRDAEGVRYVRQKLGATLESDDPTVGLGGAFWVSKELLPKGLADVIRLNDEGVGGHSFFGVEGQEGDYDTILEVSRQRESQAARDMDAKLHAMALEIRGMVRGDDCDAALLIMANHAKDFAAELCLRNETYDAAQFGPAAALHIENARRFAARGDLRASEQALEAAKQTAIVYMCGMRLEIEQPNKGGLGDCEFISKECPQCHKKNVKTTSHKGVYIGECGCRSDRVNGNSRLRKTAATVLRLMRILSD
jgi:hypothetical protein